MKQPRVLCFVILFFFLLAFELELEAFLYLLRFLFLGLKETVHPSKQTTATKKKTHESSWIIAGAVVCDLS